MVVGQNICRYGIASGYRCGQIGILNATFTSGGTTFNGFVGISPATSSGGDSGGPVMYVNSAFGSHWGTVSVSNISYSMFMPIERISVQGLYILTAP